MRSLKVSSVKTWSENKRNIPLSYFKLKIFLFFYFSSNLPLEPLNILPINTLKKYHVVVRNNPQFGSINCIVSLLIEYNNKILLIFLPIDTLNH